MRTPIPLRLVLGIATIALFSSSAGAVSPLPALASGFTPTKWVFSFDVGRNVNKTKLGNPATSQEERNECTALSEDLCVGEEGTEEGTGPREFAFEHGIAVSKQSGAVYVGDNDHRVQVLGPQGEFMFMFGWNVNKTKVASGGTQQEKNICTEAEIKGGSACGAGEVGTGLAGQINGAQSIVVDPSSGDVYVLDSDYNRLDKYSASGEFLWMAGGEVNRKGGNFCAKAEEAECQAGVQGGGHLAFDKVQNGAHGNLMSIGGAEDHLYVADEGRVQQLEANGNWVGQIPVPGEVLSVAVDAARDMFVVDSSQPGVHEYNANDVLQSCVIDPASGSIAGVAFDSAGRLGVIGFNAEVYDAGGAECGKLVAQIPGVVGSAMTFSLHENGKNEAEDRLYVAYGGDQRIEDYRPVVFPEVKTTACVPEVVEDTSARVCGEVNPNSITARGFFKYRTETDHLDEESPTAFLGEGTAFEPIAIELTDLTPNQQYFYQTWVEAQNEGVEQRQSAPEVVSFHTATPPPEVLGAPSASDVTNAFALFSASVNPEHALARYHFQYGPCAELAGCAGIVSTPVEESSVYGEIGAIQEAVGLQAQTTYSYRLVADNEHEEAGHVLQGGETVGVEGHFTTGASPVPVVQTGSVSGVGVGGAVISGLVDPDGQPAVFAFELGVYEGAGTHYGVVFSGPAGTGTTLVAESLPLSGLQPGTTYAYRVVIRSGYGEAVGETMTFTTEGLPSVLLVPAPLGMLAVPAIAFPGEAQGAATTKKATVKCKRGKRLTRGKCVASKRKKQAKKAGKTSRARRAV